MDGWIADLRAARRALTRRPGLTLAALLTLALGISVNTVIFSVVAAVYVHPLPYRDADRLVFLQLEVKQGDMTYRLLPDPEVIRAWRSRAESFEEIAAYTLREHRLDGGDETVQSAWVTPGMIPLLGVEPHLGRIFTADEALSGTRVAVLGYGLWQSRFGSDPEILGKTLAIDGEPFTILGVLPRYARFLDPHRHVRLWLPLSPNLGAGNEQASKLSLRALARLRQGVSPSSARDELDAAMSGLPSAQDRRSSLLSPRDNFGDLSSMILIVQAVVGCVLLIACVNVAHLLLAQGESRARELTMRSVLGAGRLRLLRQLLTESLALGLLGGALALLLSLWGLAALLAILPESLRYLDYLEIQDDVLAFTLAVSLLTGVLAGLVPALRGSAPNPETALRRGGAQGPPRHGLLRRGLVALEVALTLAILAGAGSMIHTFVRWQNIGFGFAPDDLLIVTLGLDDQVFSTPVSQVALAEEVAERLAGGPVSEVALANGMPLVLPDLVFAVPEAEGRPTAIDQPLLCPVVSVLPGYFRTLRISLRDGRGFTDLDQAGSEPVAVINETMAKLVWGDARASGQRFRIEPDGEWLRVVGVVADVRQLGTSFEASQPVLYRPFRQRPATGFEVAVRSTADPALLAREVEARLGDVGPGVKWFAPVTFEDRVRPQLATSRFHTLLMALFAGIATVLACVGIYGVVAFSVSQRTREIGIRMAVGARGGAIVREMLARGMVPVLAGIVAGLFGAAALAKLLNAEVHDAIRVWNPLVYSCVAALVAATALAAVWLPARRATRIDPTVTLRHE